MKDALARSQREVDAVAELVRKRQHVAPARGVVEHHVGIDGGHRRGAKGAAALAWAQRGVDVPFLEEAVREVAELRREGRVAVQNDLAGAREGESLLVGAHGGHAVVVGETLDPQQARLEAVPAARYLEAARDGLDQSAHRLVAGLVGEVARRQPVRVAAQAIVGGLVGKQRVEEVGARAQARLERLRDRLRRRAARLTLGRLQTTQGEVEGDALALGRQLDRDRRGELREQPHPGA